MYRDSTTAASLDFHLPPPHSYLSHQVNSLRIPSLRLDSGVGPVVDLNNHFESHDDFSRNSQYKPATFNRHSIRKNFGYTPAPIRSGLQTPPEDEMNTTAGYQSQHVPNYRPTESSYPYHAHAVQNVVPSVTAKHQLPAYQREAEYSSRQSRSLHAHAQQNAGSSSHQASYSRQSIASPRNTTAAMTSQQDDSSKHKSLVLPNLQVPSSINHTGGSLAEFAAEITCLFWFESTPTLQIAEEWIGSDPNAVVRRLVPDAIPSSAFRKWVVTILSTTQVTQNVILLALLFIYRLKTLNPKVKGKTGSEYRLLTVALMLGNKFLDDNTYTNKTWAEVSGISVSEIHVMEVEFLSNMRYSLLASEEQWAEWQTKLSRFSNYFDKASKSPVTLPSPTNQNPSTLLPSPPASMQSTSPALSTYSPNAAPFNYNQPWSSAYVAPLVSPLASLPDHAPELHLQPVSRKRSYDEAVDEPPAKRITRSVAAQMAMNPTLPMPRQNVPRLPLPNLSVTTQMNGYPTTSYQQNMNLLPPLGSRAMSTVFPTTPSYTPQSQASLTPVAQVGHAMSQSQNGTTYNTPSRRHSPRSVQDLLSLNSSPISGVFPTHNLNSPSFFLQQRSSPYRPVRPPNTLLYPPPSASMHYQPPNIEQMHYQPLGKRNDYRSGLVPEYASHTPYPGWHGLSQPNFT